MPKGIVGLPEQLRGLKKRFMARRQKEEPAAAAVDSSKELVKSE
jgi:hypothetical protein